MPIVTSTSVTYTRLDSLAANSPDRFVSGIAVDPANANHAWLSYSSYSTLTPATPGHVFSVTYDPVHGTATWTNLDGSGGPGFPDFPATGIAYDSVRGDVYVSNDWGVLKLPHGSSNWDGCRRRPPHGGGCRPYHRAKCAEAVRRYTRSKRLGIKIALEFGFSSVRRLRGMVKAIPPRFLYDPISVEKIFARNWTVLVRSTAMLQRD